MALSAGSEGMKKNESFEVRYKIILVVWNSVYKRIENSKLTIDKIHKQMHNTKNKIDKKGRALYFGDRSIVYIDLGPRQANFF